jgi:hypothetical protein
MPKTPSRNRKRRNAEKRHEPHNQLLFETTRLLTDLQCMRELFKMVTPIITEQDRASLERLTDVAAKLTTVSQQKHRRHTTTTRLGMTYGELKTIKDTALRYQRTDYLFRSSALITLVTRFDSYVSALLRLALLAYPERLNRSDKFLTYEEAMKFTSLDEIKLSCVSHDVEPVMRGSHDDQFRYAETVTNLKLREILPAWPEFIEITERRNVHAHCAGKVSAQYLSVCRANKVILASGLKQGSDLQISESYFDSACRVIWLIGFTMGQMVVRKLFPTQIEAADAALNDIGFDLLLGEDWSLSLAVFDFATNLPLKAVSDDSSRKMFLINKCIALKSSGKTQECLEELSRVDWSSSITRFVLAVAVLRDEFEDAAKLMAQAARGEHAITERSLCEWPLFRDFRKTQQFQKAFKRIFKKDFTEISLATLTSLTTGAEAKTDNTKDQAN